MSDIGLVARMTIPADMLTDSAAAGQSPAAAAAASATRRLRHSVTALPCATDAIIYRRGIALSFIHQYQNNW